jgi:hypothetical protein
MPAKISFFISVCFSILSVSCAPQESIKPSEIWNFANLRSLSTYDDLISGGDFIAGYSRFAGRDLQIRFDVIDLNLDQNTDYYVALDVIPGGTTQLPIQGNAEIEWDTLLFLPAIGSPKAYSPDDRDDNNFDSGFTAQFPVRGDLIPRLVKIPWQDYVLISVNRDLLPRTTKGFKIQAFSTDQGSRVVSDTIGPFSSESLPPKRAPILLAFWNSFPAYSPAQSLRRWDGAHTGPFGERHGLSILLDTISRSGVPVALLDLRDPFALSALDFLDALPLIRELLSAKLLILPDLIPGSPSYPIFPQGLPSWASEKYLQDLKAISKQHGLSSSTILYTPQHVENIPGNYVLTFGPENEVSHNQLSGYHLPIPAQVPDELQASPFGLPLAIRKKLLDNALHINKKNSEYPLLILGGSLPDSAFADPSSADATMRYIANHPWIQPLNEDDLRSLPENVSPELFSGETTGSSVERFSPSEVLSELPYPMEDDQYPLYRSAWDSALSLYAPLPPEPEMLPSLRSNYTGQPGIILEAARWAENPQPQLDCKSDPDLDGIQECILASDQHFAIFDLEGGRLVAYYSISGSELHQIIAPTSQFVVGLGDPSTWFLDAGEGSDSKGIHGAFADTSPPWVQYDVTTNNGQLSFTSPGQRLTKIFSLSETGLQVEYQTTDPIIVQIPIAIDPWLRFSPGWSDEFHCLPILDGYSCQLTDNFSVEIETDASISASTFVDSRAHLAVPEDPNLDYPTGHYLPFPLALIEIKGERIFTVRFTPFP